MIFNSENIRKRKNRDIYNAMFKHSTFPSFEKVIYQSGDNAYMLKETVKNDKCETLIELFDIDNPDLFRLKYQQAVSGDGNEESRILTLVSSTLCALLFFYNITDTNPLELELNNKRVVFSKSIFEFRNVVFSNPSNIDVTLVGKDQQGNRVVLLLESKMVEYYRDVNIKSKEEISNKYLSDKIASKLYSEDLGYEIVNSNSGFRLHSNEISYIDGIKQMISHFVGVKNLVDGKYSDKNGHGNLELMKECVEDENAKFYLGVILFDKKIGELKLSTGEACLRAFMFRYRSLVKLINERFNSSKLEMLNEVMLYSLFQNNKFFVEEKIKKFYFS